MARSFLLLSCFSWRMSSTSLMRRLGPCFSSFRPDLQLRSSAPALFLPAHSQKGSHPICNGCGVCFDPSCFVRSLSGIRIAMLFLGFAAVSTSLPRLQRSLPWSGVRIGEKPWGSIQQHPLLFVLGPLMSPHSWACLLESLVIHLGVCSLLTGHFSVFWKVWGFPGDAPKPAALKQLFDCPPSGHHSSVYDISGGSVAFLLCYPLSHLRTRA